MLKKIFSKKNILIMILSIIELILYIRILIIDGEIASRYFCYASVAFAFAFSLFGIMKKEEHLEIGALTFTLLADTCLVLLRPQTDILRLFGLIFFNITQILHMLYINKSLSKVEKRNSYIIRGILASILLIACILVLRNNVDIVSLLTMVYFSNLVCNIISAIKKYKTNKIYLFGLLFFVGCDIFVGMQDLFYSYITISYTSFLYKFFNPPFDAIWFFYVPSQTLLAINVINKSRIKNIGNN